MLLYHFTAADFLTRILTEGLWRGEVPLTHKSEDCLNAVWLTSDHEPSGHGLSEDRKLSDGEKEVLGVPLHIPATFPNKRAIRLTVAIPRDDRRLVLWTSWGRKRLTDEWFSTLNRTGGGKHRTWWLYFGTIPPEWIKKVEDLRCPVPELEGMRP